MKFWILESNLIRPEPILATNRKFSSLAAANHNADTVTNQKGEYTQIRDSPRNRLTMDYTTYDDEIASYTANNLDDSKSNDAIVPNTKSKFEPKNEASCFLIHI